MLIDIEVGFLELEQEQVTCYRVAHTNKSKEDVYTILIKSISKV